MPRVRWDTLSPGVYEDMVAVLLSHLNPAVRRIDGSGGDGGRDVFFKTPARLDVSELKSFTGRMTPVRRRQVERSLERAKSLKPDSWTLVVPIDPTPGEETWFDSLRGSCPFPIDWKGFTWLETQMAERPFIPRYFVEGVADEVINCLREFDREQAALARGVPDALERLAHLAARLNKVDPFYTFDIRSEGSTREVSVRARYEGATTDRPIKASFRLAFPDTDEGRETERRFGRFLEFGEPVEVEGQYVERFALDAPAGLAHESSGGTSLRLGPSEVDQPWKFDVALVALAPDGHTAGELPVRFDQRTRGMRGGILHGSDRTGALRVRMQIDLGAHKIETNMAFTTPEGALPEDVVPVLDVLRLLRAPNLFLVCEASTRAPFGEPTPAAGALFVDDDYIKVIQALARIQRETRQRFPIPAIFTPADLEAMDRALYLLDGKAIGGTWTDMNVTTTPRRLQAFRSVIEQGTFPLEYVADAPEMIQIADRTINLGRPRLRYASARIENAGQVLQSAAAAADQDSPLSVRFVPGESDRVEISLNR